MMMMFVRRVKGSWHILKGEVGERGRRLQHHEGASFSRDNQVNICFEEWRQDHKVMVLVAIQVGNFMSMVKGREWWKVKKRQLNLLK
jgi:Holliday junction resolvase RusA-like endonuclease